MAVSACRDRRAVPQQRTDQRQARATGNERGGEAVPQIMDAQSVDASGLAQLRPVFLQLDAVAALPVAGKHELAERLLRIGRGLLLAYLVQQLPRRCRQWCHMVAALLGGRARLGPDAFAE